MVEARTDIVSKWTVVVVDDEPDSVEVATDVLEFHGATVHGASNGMQALQLLARVHPTFVLTDLSMPEMDGWQLLWNIRQNEAYENLPVIALTAHAMEGDAERALAAGFTAYITKPLSAFTLIDDILERIPALSDNSKEIR